MFFFCQFFFLDSIVIILDTDWRQRQKSQQQQQLSTIGGSNVRIRSNTTKNSSSDLNLAVDCVASRTRSRALINTPFSSKPNTGIELPLSSNLNNKKTITSNSSLTPSSSSTSISNHPSTSKGRGEEKKFFFLLFPKKKPIQIILNFINIFFLICL